MKILDRYVLTNFIVNYAVCFAVLVGLFVLVDAFERFDTLQEWMETAKAEAEEGRESAVGERSVVFLLGTYYLYNIPVIFVQISGAITLTAAMFTLTRLARAGEIVPMKASGISLYRVVAPIFLAGVALAIGTAFVQEFVIPPIAPELRDVRHFESGGKAQFNDQIVQDSARTLFLFERFYPVSGKCEGIRIEERYPDPPRRLKRVVKAAEGRWEQREDGTFLSLSRGAVDEFHRETGRRLPGFPKLFGDECSLYRTEFSPIDIIFTDQMALLSYRSLTDLAREAARQPGVAPIQVEIANRFGRPLGQILLLFLGLPFVLGRETKNFFLSVILAVVISGAYFVTALYATKLGYNSLIHPLAAAWLPLILYGALAACLADMIRT